MLGEFVSEKVDDKRNLKVKVEEQSLGSTTGTKAPNHQERLNGEQSEKMGVPCILHGFV